MKLERRMRTFESVDSVPAVPAIKRDGWQIPKRGNDGRLTLRTVLLAVAAMGIQRFIPPG